MKAFNSCPIFPCKMSWDFCKKTESNDILNTWKMIFQASDFKEKQFLDLLDDDFNIIKPSQAKRGPWLKSFNYLNLLYVRAMKVIMNHAPIGEYRLRFFSREEFKCLCRLYPIKSKHHILYKCRRFNRY